MPVVSLTCLGSIRRLLFLLLIHLSCVGAGSYIKRPLLCRDGWSEASHAWCASVQERGREGVTEGGTLNSCVSNIVSPQLTQAAEINLLLCNVYHYSQQLSDLELRINKCFYLVCDVTTCCHGIHALQPISNDHVWFNIIWRMTIYMEARSEFRDSGILGVMLSSSLVDAAVRSL